MFLYSPQVDCYKSALVYYDVTRMGVAIINENVLITKPCSLIKC